MLLLTTGIVLSLPFVQTKIGSYLTDSLKKDFDVYIKVEKVTISVFGGVKLKSVMIRDHHADTLIFAQRIQTDILSYSKLLDGDLLFGDIRIDSLNFKLKTYKNESKSNFDVFLKKFDKNKKPTAKPFLLLAQNAYISDSHFIIIDENRPKNIVENFKNFNASLNKFQIIGPDVTTKINKLSFKEVNGLQVKNLAAKFTYTKKNILLQEMDLQTKNTDLQGNITLKYDVKDFADFNNKVLFDIDIDKSEIGTSDIYLFYKGIAQNQKLNLKSHIKGTLNNLKFNDLLLKNNNNLLIDGKIIIENTFGTEKQKFKLDGDFNSLQFTRQSLIALAPSVLKDKLPENLDRLGNITITGQTILTKKNLLADIAIITNIGKIAADIDINNIDNVIAAKYNGKIALQNFDLGKFLNRKDLGQTTLNLVIDGSGFSQKNVNAKTSGTISKVFYNQYLYSNITVDGVFKSPLFQGKLHIDDPNLKMEFDGLINIRRTDNKLDFNAKIDYANLVKLNFIKDSLSIFQGDIKMDVTGNSIDNIQGIINVSRTSYQNSKDKYVFDDFTITSDFDNRRERTVTINSPDIIEGKLVGRFQFNQLRKMAENAVGSLYANYSPNKIKKGQYLKFNFSIYNKIIEIFYPGIEVAPNTEISGNINADLDEFKLKFDSPNIKAFDNIFDKIKIDIDNKNPLYNAYVEMDSIKTKQYKISNFSLINVTANDTLFIRSEFKGGKKAEDFYNMNLYHTIDANNNSVVGIKKSELKFKDYLWFLNEDDADENKIVFDKKFKNFTFENIMLTHDKQKITLSGNTKGATYKDLQLNFDGVNLGKILPDIVNLKLDGNLNGKVNFKQNNAVYQPTAAVSVDSLSVNNIFLGDLNVNIVGNETFKKFNVNATIENNSEESVAVNGDFMVDKSNTILDLEARFNKFNLQILSPFGKDVITDIRGFVSGASTITGNAKKPDINGRLFLEQAGMRIPYLNTNYSLKENSIIDLGDNQFIIQNNALIDTKYKTEGKLNGVVRHKNFSDWKLDLLIESNRFLVLDTEYFEDAAYFGTAFIDGKATIKGPTNGLFIAVNATSSKGTDIKIPINNTEASSDKNFIHFLSPKEKFNFQKGIVTEVRNYNGLELKFDLNITKDAIIEIILDRDSGHGMTARGDGTLLLEINTLGKFKMTGDYSVDKGEYNFKYKGINKKFAVKPNSSIVWEGDPLKARLNLEAIYKLPTGANPSALLDNPSINRKVDVSVSIGITGSLASPEPDFNINFPTISSTLKSEIQTKLNDPIIRQTQALTLLGTGSFASAEGLNQNSVYNNLLESAGDIFSNIFQNSDDKLKVSLLVATADRTPNRETNGQVGVSFNSQINERISINGRVGVPVGGVNQSTIVGNVEILYRVNEDGSLNLRVFNRENDINYIGQGIGYTQGLGVNYNVDFDTFSELLNKIFKKAKLKRLRNQNEILDSDIPENIGFPDNNPRKEEPKEIPELDAIPPKDD